MTEALEIFKRDLSKVGEREIALRRNFDRPAPALVFQPHPLAATGRRLLDVTALPGESLAAFLARALPDVPITDPRLVWVAAIDGARVPRAMWAKVYPKPGRVIWLVASLASPGKGKNPLQTLLSIGLFFVAPGIGNAIAGGLGLGGWSATVFGQTFTAGQIFGGLVSIAGNLLIGRLFSPSNPTLSQASGQAAQPSPTYSITGSQNRARPFQPLPLTMGRHVVSLDYGAKPFTEYLGEDQWLYQVFNAGLSDLVLSNYRIGNTPITSYPDVTIQESGPDGKLTLCPGNVDTIAGGALEYNVYLQRTSSPDAIALAVDLTLQGYAVSDEGQIQGASIAYSAEYRAVGASVWLPMVGGSAVVSTTGRNDRKPARVTHKITVARGQYEVRVSSQTNIAAFANSDRYTFELGWNQLRTYQPDDADYTGQKRIAVQIKASALANGTLDQFNVIGSARHEAWNGAAWVLQETSNPAWIGRWFALGKRIAGRRAFGCDMSDAELDLDSWKAFGAWCDSKSLTFNAQLDFSRTAGEVLEAILRCGRGRRTWANDKLGVVWDAGGQPMVGSFSMANIKRESFKVAYIAENTPDGVEVVFVNPANNWEQDSVRCPRPGVTDPANFARVEIWGCTDADMAGREGNLIAAAYEYSRRRVTLEQDIEGVFNVAGDVVGVTHDLTQWAYSGRLVAGTSTVLQLDRSVPFTPGRQHWLRLEFPNKTFRTLAVNYFAGETDTITLTAAMPVGGGGDPYPFTPDADPKHPPYDFKWAFEPAATPGKLMKIVGTLPKGMQAFEFTLIDELDAYYAREFAPFDYVPSGGSLTAAPTLTNVVATVDLIRSGAGYVSVVTLVWDVVGLGDVVVVRAGLNGAPLEERDRTYSRRSEILVADTGTLQVQITVFGPRGQWTPAGQVTQTLTIAGAGGPPPNMAGLALDGDTLRWPASSWATIAGAELRYHAGDYRSWEDATPLVAGLITETQYTMPARPVSGTITLMAKWRTTAGVYSEAPVYVVAGLGDADVANVVATIDLKALGFPGTISGATVSGGDLVANNSTAFYGPDDSAPIFGPDDAAPIFAAASYSELVYESAEFIPDQALSGSRMTLDAAVAGVPYFLEYRLTGPAPFYSGNDSNAIYGPDDAAPLFDAPPDWSAWPGSITVTRQPYQVRVRVAQGAVQGVVSALAVVIDAPDAEEYFNNLAIAAGGTRLPITKPWAAIANVQLTLEDDGGTAVTARWLDKDAALGPLIKVFNSANTATTGRLDARIKGYLQ